MRAFSHIIIIYNPKSTGDSQVAARALKKRLDTYYPGKIELVPTKHEDHAEALAFNAAMKYTSPLVISSSGDGGYHEVVNGLMRAKEKGANPYSAVLPAGNANDHHGATAKMSIERAIIEEKAVPLDVLKVTIDNKTVHFGHSYIGLGLTPAVAAELNEHSLNAFKEIGIVLRQFYNFRPVKIKVNHEVLTLDSLIITNIGRMAKVLRFNESTPDDGLCEVTYFVHRSKPILVSLLLKAVLRGLNPDIQVKNFQFQARKPIPMQIDGELFTLHEGANVRVEVKKHMLRAVQ